MAKVKQPVHVGVGEVAKVLTAGRGLLCEIAHKVAHKTERDQLIAD